MKLTDERIDEISDSLIKEISDGQKVMCMKEFARAIEAACKPKIGGVLTYKKKATTRPHGQILGADGAGEYAVVIYGTPEQADIYSREFIHKHEKHGARICDCCFVSSEEGYYGSPLEVAEVGDKV